VCGFFFSLGLVVMVVMAMRVFSRTPLCVHHQKFASTTTTASSSFFPFRGLAAAAGASPPNCSSSSSSQKSGVHSLKNTSLSAGAVTTEEEEEEEEVEKELGTLLRRRTETITGEPPSCPVPNFAPGANEVTLLDPLNLLPKALQQQQKKKATHDDDDDDDDDRPLLLYVPGMDCTGKGIASQLPTLAAAGYDIRCVYIPSDNRSTWQELVQMVCHLLQKEVEEDEEGTETTQKQQRQRQHRRHLTVVGESFGACLAIRLALASPSLITHLVLVYVSHQCCACLGVVLTHFGCASIGLVLILMEDNGIRCVAEQWWVAD
jgi:hypothetical protein